MEFTDQYQFKTEKEFQVIMDPLPIMVRANFIATELCYFNSEWRRFSSDLNVYSAGIHQEFRLEFDRLFASYSESRTAFKTKYKYKDGVGVYRWLAEQSVPWYSTEGSFIGFICYALDIEELIDTADDYNRTEALQREQTLNEELETSNEGLNVINEELQRSQEDLSQANNKLEQVLNMLPASVVIIRGYDLVVEMINNSNLAYWERTKDQVLGKPFLQILPDLTDQPFASQLRRVIETGETIDVRESPVLFTSPDGSTRETYVDYTYQPLSDLEGKRTGVLVMSFEITDRVLSRKLLEKYAEDLISANAQLLLSNDELAISEARFKYLIQEAPVAIGILHQRDLIIESANAKILEVWGKTSEIVGKSLSAALPELQGQPFLGILDQVYTTGQAFYANEIRSLLEHDGELKEIFF
ncbi:MAG: PAS domain-containing protein [Pedobacter sp.]